MVRGWTAPAASGARHGQGGLGEVPALPALRPQPPLLGECGGASPREPAAAGFGVSLAGWGAGHLRYLHGCGRGRAFRSAPPSSPPRLRSIPDPAQTPSSRRCPSAGLSPAHLGDRVLAGRRGLRWFLVSAGCFRHLGQCWGRAEFVLN